MAPRGTRDAIIIIFDIGKSVSERQNDADTSFFDKSRECLSWILRRKIMSYSKDLICILLIGADQNNGLENSSNNLCIKYDFEVPSWDMLNFIENTVKTTDKTSDWVGALDVALEKLSLLQESWKLANKTLVLLSDLNHTLTNYRSDLVKHIKNLGVEITVIGSDYLSKESIEEENEEFAVKKRRLERETPSRNEKVDGQKMIYLIWNGIGDLMRICSFDSALKQLSFYTKKTVKPVPWNCLLDIGDLKIIIQMFKKVDNKICHPYKARVIKPGCHSNLITEESLSDVVRDKIMSYTRKNENDLDHEEVSVGEDDLIGGYRYGTSLIPFSDEDKTVMGFKPGQKCLSVLGFTHMDNIPYYIFIGYGSYVVVPRNGDEKSEIALSALIQALCETNHVAIVRRVYSENRGLSLGVLYPIVEESGDSSTEHKECLVFIELAFQEDVRNIRLPLLRGIKQIIKPEQYALIDDIIDELDLMKADRNNKGEECELLDLSSRHEVKNQFFQHCIVHKALYPDLPLPKHLPNSIHPNTLQPKSLVLKSKSFKERLLKLFPYKISGSAENSDHTSDSCLQSEKVISMYTFPTVKERTAENCFKKLFSLQRYPKQEDVATLLKLATEEFHFKQDDVISAFLHSVSMLRTLTLKNYTDDYNYWLRRLRVILGVEGDLQRNFWQGILKGNLGLITESEHCDSNLKEADVNFFISSINPVPKEAVLEAEINAEEEEALNLLF